MRDKDVSFFIFGDKSSCLKCQQIIASLVADGLRGRINIKTSDENAARWNGNQHIEQKHNI